METCSHSFIYDEQSDNMICTDCGVVKKQPDYQPDFSPYNMDLMNNHYDYTIDSQFHILSYHYAPIFIRRIRDTYVFLKSITGRVSHEFIPVSIYYGLRDVKPIKPLAIDNILHSSKGTSQKYINKYSKHFDIVQTDRKKIDKRKFNSLMNTKYLTEL